MKNIDGYLKLNANTLGSIAENYDLINEVCNKKGLTLINIFTLDTCILGFNQENNKPLMDKGNYVSIHIDYRFIKNKLTNIFFKEVSLNERNSFIYEILEEISENIGLRDFSLTNYLQGVEFKEVKPFATKLIEFNKKEDIITYCMDIKSKYNPSKDYDFIYPVVRNNNTQKVRKNFKIGIIDAVTGKEMIPCK